MLEFLFYRFPGEDLKRYSGYWTKCSLEALPDDVFFTSNFLKNEVYYFTATDVALVSNDDINALIHCFNVDLDHILTKEKYVAKLKAFIEDFPSNAVSKAIFSREVPLSYKTTIDWKQLINDLCLTYPNTCVYLMGSKQFGIWTGATPEILLSGNAKKMETMALAGTKWSEDKPWSNKELYEQGLVKDYINEKLEQFNVDDLKVSSIKTVSAGPVYHLCNDFNFKLDASRWNDLMRELHPTPAVCGVPLKNALDLIAKHENYDRKKYTGLIGLKSTTSLKVYVNLRCMQLFKDIAILYVGGGITEESNPTLEWEETENKAKTLSKFLIS